MVSGCVGILVTAIVCISLTISLFHRNFINEGYRVISKEVDQKLENVTVLSTSKDYSDYHVDESGEVPVMMYHGIHNEITSEETGYTGGNVDVDGYQRTADAFEKDLEFYYQNGYRMIRLDDYLDGNIDVEAGKSPLILTFDDGLANNIYVTGLDENGEIIIDPTSAVGILESFKEKYPDFNVTATFFIMGAKFRQPEYDVQIIQWLVNHGYDVGNHTMSHVDFTTSTVEAATLEVGYIYDMLDNIIPGQYVNIVALPFGSPYDYNHELMPTIYDCTLNGKTYHTKAAMQVAWKPNESPFYVDFQADFIKRIRAYDNNGTEFDIEYTFNLLEDTRYISDGNPHTIVVPEDKKDLIGYTYDKHLITY